MASQLTKEEGHAMRILIWRKNMSGRNSKPQIPEAEMSIFKEQ